MKSAFLKCECECECRFGGFSSFFSYFCTIEYLKPKKYEKGNPITSSFGASNEC